MRCYYDILGVSRDVEVSELKKAYYKLSLQWHPDKNTDNEDTTQVFQQIQEAYRVLSDPHERAWYDSHRTQILRSGEPSGRMGGSNVYNEESVDVFLYFTRSCFKGFDDDEKGFYTVYRKVFEAIAKEEMSAVPEGSSDSDELDPSGTTCSYPSFGLMNSEYSTVVAPFYQFWEGFRTRKSYSWLDKYDTRLANSRQERRAMETENCRLRKAARKKRNEEVRELVVYVKKRDKRVALEKERVQLANRETQTRIQNATKEAKQRDAERLIEAWEEELHFGGLGAQWAKDLEDELSRLDAELSGMPMRSIGETTVERSTEEAELLSDSDELYCIACDKLFNSVKAKMNHESSKKHKKQAELLRLVLLAEDDKETANHMESNDRQRDDDLLGGPPSHLLGEVKLTKRAKKAQRRRLHEAEKQAAVSAATVSDSIPTPEKTVLPEHAGDMDPDVEHPTTEIPDPTPKFVSCKSERNDTNNPPSCATCGSQFPSRNKLFMHLNESGHAAVKGISKKSQRKR